MSSRWRVALTAVALLQAGAAPACELMLVEHRSQRVLLSLPLDPVRPTATVAFTHSVLGTPVADRYEWRAAMPVWRAHLIEERFQGEGYGLPNAAGPGESLVRDGDGWRLRLDRLVHPLVVPPVQGMRVGVGDRPAVWLRDLSQQSIELRAEGCGAH